MPPSMKSGKCRDLEFIILSNHRGSNGLHAQVYLGRDNTWISFYILAIFIELYITNLTPTFINIIKIHLDHLVIYIVDTDLHVLRISFYYLGKFTNTI